jgi:uncharacterized membrane protein YtjA (UPF0391 family)
MKRNMGNTDRIIRAIIALTIAVLYFSGIITGTIGIILLIVSVIFLLTSLLSFCPVYLLFGIKTCTSQK